MSGKDTDKPGASRGKAKQAARRKRQRQRKIRRMLGGSESFPFARPPQPVRGAMRLWTIAEWSLLQRGLLKPGRMPDVIGIGAQKAGSSWLWRELNQHPEIAMAQPKELHYFDRFPWTPVSRYARKFRIAERAKGEGCRLVGEITPAYGILPVEAIRRIHMLAPDAKIVFLMRQPIERGWSMLRMDLAKRRRRDVEDVPTEEFLKVIERDAFTARGDYLGIIDNWLSVYPKEQVFIDFFDRIGAEPAALMDDLHRFLGVAEVERADDASLARKQFVSPEGEMPAEVYQRLASMYGEKIERLGDRFENMPDSWRIDAGV